MTYGIEERFVILLYTGLGRLALVNRATGNCEPSKFRVGRDRAWKNVRAIAFEVLAIC